MAKRYKIVYNRSNCIMVASCAAVAPLFYKINEADSKADLINGKEIEPGIFEAEIDEKDLKVNLEAAEVCPVRVIKIIDLETGKEIEV